MSGGCRRGQAQLPLPAVVREQQPRWLNSTALSEARRLTRRSQGLFFSTVSMARRSGSKHRYQDVKASADVQAS